MSFLKVAVTMGTVEEHLSKGQFSHIQIWRNLVAFARRNVEVRRHLVRFKTYEKCFAGCDVVDVIFHHLRLEEHVFTKVVTRDKAAKVCQVLLDNAILVTVNGSSKFEDNSSKLYRFNNDLKNDEEESEVVVVKHTGLASDISVLSSSSPSSKLACESTTVDMSIGAKKATKLQVTVFRRSSFSGKLVQRFRNRCVLSTGEVPFTPSVELNATNGKETSLSHNSTFAEPNVEAKGESDDESEVLTQECISQLTALMDIPMLDGILQTTLATAQQTGRRDKVEGLHFINQRMLNRFESIAVIMSEGDKWRGTDHYWQAGLRCLDLIKEGGSILDAALSESTPLTQKLRMYRGICDHYSSAKLPLWPSSYQDLQLGILSFLMKGAEKEGSTLRALQLSLRLLDAGLAEELGSLLTFLAALVDLDDVHLSRVHSNAEVVEKVFAKAFIQDKLLTDTQVGQLIMFMIRHEEELWTIPEDVQLIVRTRLDSTSTQNGASFCMKISPEEFSRQKHEDTCKALVEMMKSLVANPKMSNRIKQKRLEEFRQHHPRLYLEHLSTLQIRS